MGGVEDDEHDGRGPGERDRDAGVTDDERRQDEDDDDPRTDGEADKGQQSAQPGDRDEDDGEEEGEQGDRQGPLHPEEGVAGRRRGGRGGGDELDDVTGP